MLKRKTFEILDLTEKLASTEEALAALRRHLDVSPQARPEYSIGGYIPSEGAYRITEPSILISFPDPSNCLSVADTSETESMKPLLGADHTVIENTCWKKSDLREGDIITWKNDDGLVVHQIVEIRSDGVITKGTHNEGYDGLVEWNQIHSAVVAIVY